MTMNTERDLLDRMADLIASANVSGIDLDWRMEAKPLLEQHSDLPPATADAAQVDRVLMPRALTAENGAKAALLGEFSFGVTWLGEHVQNVTVPWTTIKEIYAKAVELFTHPQTQPSALVNAAFAVIENHDSGSLASEHIETLRTSASRAWKAQPSAATAVNTADGDAVAIACQSLFEHGYVWDSRLEIAVESALKLVVASSPPASASMSAEVTDWEAIASQLAENLDHYIDGEITEDDARIAIRMFERARANTRAGVEKCPKCGGDLCVGEFCFTCKAYTTLPQECPHGTPIRYALNCQQCFDGTAGDAKGAG